MELDNHWARVEARHVRLQQAVGAEEVTARIYDLTRLLFEDPAVAAALDEATATTQWAAEAVERSRSSLTSALVPLLCRPNTLSAYAARLLIHVTMMKRPVDAAQAHLTTVLPWGIEQSTLAEILEALPDQQIVQALTIDQLLQLSDHVLLELERYRDALRQQLMGRTADAEFNERLARVRQLLREGLRDLVFVRRLCQVASLEPAVRSLRFVHEAVARMAARGVPVPFGSEDDVLRELQSEAALDALKRHAKTVTDALQSIADQGTHRYRVLVRLVAYLEHFGKHYLLGELRRARRSRRKLESVIQHVVDAFVFSEGLVPIVHCAAAGGSIDTFVEVERADLFGMVTRTELPPLLLELKQVLALGDRKKVTAAAIRTAISEARTQAEIYRSHLSAKPRWSASRVIALVVYDGPKRYLQYSPDVRLAYLGSAKPSDGATEL